MKRVTDFGTRRFAMVSIGSNNSSARRGSAAERTEMTKTPLIRSRWTPPVLALLIAASALYGVGTAHGKECLKVSFPDQTVVDGSPLALNGLGLRQATVLRVNVYVAALYVTKPSADPGAILAAP